MCEGVFEGKNAEILRTFWYFSLKCPPVGLFGRLQSLLLVKDRLSTRIVVELRIVGVKCVKQFRFAAFLCTHQNGIWSTSWNWTSICDDDLPRTQRNWPWPPRPVRKEKDSVAAVFKQVTHQDNLSSCRRYGQLTDRQIIIVLFLLEPLVTPMAVTRIRLIHLLILRICSCGCPTWNVLVPVFQSRSYLIPCVSNYWFAYWPVQDLSPIFKKINRHSKWAFSDLLIRRRGGKQLKSH